MGNSWKIMTTQEKIKKAEAKIAKWQEKLDALKQQEQEKPLTGWEMPKNGDKCYNIQGNGEIQGMTHVDSSGYYAKSVKSLNAFSIEAKAQEIANAQLAYRMAKKFSDEWEGESRDTFFQVFYSANGRKLMCEGTKHFPSIGHVFRSRECVEAFIDQHGKEYAQLLGWELEG